VYGEYAGSTRNSPKTRQQYLNDWKAGADFTATWQHTAPIANLNRILWGAVKGWDKAYPQIQTRAFSPLAIDIDDDEREEAEEREKRRR
jgi:hypothetical protein